ncbi:DUF4755 domain-containing protein [Duganella phyllosphaerae]|uniref:Uncharacterized protein n=1 Tax=Duganella phyllosphaerae TaxID=762836 RepID=A0A1E7WH84_9BURK|nr:DUF4755 domain-containing protein [Duganella phyllosphaerae]OEZ97973.1 hypothetical protein DUPY_32440 [Duganella phyllosphaerae]
MGMFLRFIFSIIFAMITSFAALQAESSITTLIALAIAFTPLALTFRTLSARRAKKVALFAAAYEAIGVPAGSARFAHQEGDTLIVLNPNTRKISLSVSGESKVYGYDEVREWDARKVSRTGGAVGFGGVGTIAAGSQNIAASMKADRETGLFLTMRDIEHPQWRVSMFDASDRARWAEILRQELSEGGVAA